MKVAELELSLAPLSGVTRARATLAETLAEEFEQKILSGEWGDGARLPSQQKLADAYRVSRPILREAIEALRERDLVRTVNGVGSFIRRPDLSTMSQNLRRMLRLTNADVASVPLLFEARAAIEARTARFAALRATPADIARIAGALQDMRSNTRDANGWTRADCAFHLAIADGAHNVYLRSFADPLTVLFEAHEIQAHQSWESIVAALRDHDTMLAAIRAHDADAAQAAMETHLETSERYLTETLQGMRGSAEDHRPEVAAADTNTQADRR
ncbi:MAG: FadR/GntR family transcriptional regulator [Candidatus Dormibacteraceae bacterium]